MKLLSHEFNWTFSVDPFEWVIVESLFFRVFVASAVDMGVH